MKWSHIHRQPVHYGLTPAAFPWLGLLLIFVFAIAIAWLIRAMPIWLGF
jgi:hypothetical protein